MKVTLFIQDFYGGGAQHMFVNMANEFSTRGHSVDLLAVNAKGPYRDKINENVNIIDLEKKRSFMAIFSLSNYFKTARTDIFVSAMTHSNILSVLAKIFSFNKNTKLVVTERTFLSEHIKWTDSKKDKLAILGVKLFYRFADKIIGISKGVSEDIKSIAGVSNSKVGYIYNPVITDDMNADLPNKDKNDKAVIITSGRLYPEKDHISLLKAFLLLKKDKDVRLVFLGEGPLKQQLLEFAKENNIESDIEFPGFVSNSLDYMKSSDVFVMSSLYEGFCNTIVEALYCGLPIVSTDCPSGPREILDHGKYGHLVPIGDVDALASALHKALEEEVDPVRQQQRAGDFTVKKICDEYENLFTVLLGKSE